jgi:hypothetical protein
MKQSIVAILVLFLVPVANICAQVASEGAARQSVIGLGVSGGSTAGVGLSFRHHLPAAFSYQFTGGIIKVDDKLSYAVGAEAQVDLERGSTTRFYVVGGIGYYYSGSSDVNEIEGPGRMGMGVGGEFRIGAGFHGSVDIMFTYFTDGTVLPLPQIGVHYYFF